MINFRYNRVILIHNINKVILFNNKIFKIIHNINKINNTKIKINKDIMIQIKKIANSNIEYKYY